VIPSEIPKYEKGGATKIAIVQTGSFGDNINSTLMFKPIKEHYQNCILDIHTSTKYGNVFLNNPYIDNIIYHAASTKQEALHLGVTVPKTIARSNYDRILVPHPMFNPDKWHSSLHPEWEENLIFAWVNALESLGIKYEVPLQTVLRLTQDEIDKVNTYMERVPKFKERRNILLEIHGESGQTFWNENWTFGVGRHLLDGNTNLHISHAEQRGDIVGLKDQYRGQVHWIGKLTIRECAQLFNHCDAFISVSSGLSNACNTNWCNKDVKWFEVVNSLACSSAAIRTKGKVFWHDHDIDGFIKTLDQNLSSK
jgi:ADP-heptose:LPS heptosyltransferase